jgi:hypothetical protein
MNSKGSKIAALAAYLAGSCLFLITFRTYFERLSSRDPLLGRKDELFIPLLMSLGIAGPLLAIWLFPTGSKPTSDSRDDAGAKPPVRVILRMLSMQGLFVAASLLCILIYIRQLWLMTVDYMQDYWQAFGMMLPFVAVAIYLIPKIAVELNSVSRAIEENKELQKEIGEDFFNKLVRINFNYLDAYYLQTQRQAGRSFVLCLFAALVGLGVLVWGIVLMYRGGGKEFAGYVASGAGVLSEFIAAVFFYIYNATLLKMSDYHQKLVITQNIALALKTTETLPQSEQTQSRVALVQELIKDVNALLAKTSEK